MYSKKILLPLATGVCCLAAQLASAHTAGGPLGADASATDLALVQCFNDGNGEPDRLLIQVEDLSKPEAGVLLSMQALAANKMINITDTVSGDAQPSAIAKLSAGQGPYYISVNKTGAGVRVFNVTYHCETSQGVHTGSDVTVLQVQ